MRGTSEQRLEAYIDKCEHLVNRLSELVIRNARLVLPEGVIRGELSVEKGKIQEIAVSGLGKGDTEIDAKGKILMPGVIDTCVHIRARGSSYREDFHDCSVAAIAGGITTIITLPLNQTTQTPKSIQNLIRAGQKNSLVDFATHVSDTGGGLVKNALKIASLGVKFFTIPMWRVIDAGREELEQLMSTVKPLDGMVTTDARFGEMGRDEKTIKLQKLRKDPSAHAETHPEEVEEKTARKVMEAGRHTKCRVHFFPVTTKKTSEVILEFKKRKLKVSSGTCLHFLTFTKKDMEKFGPFLKVEPPLRTNEDRMALWKALEEGTIDTVASGHTPVSRDEKEEGWKNIWKVPAGIPALETLLPVMLKNSVAAGRLTLENVVNILCTKPAKIFGFYPQKGIISKGSDADLVMVDFQKEITLNARKLHSAADWTPYDGLKLKGTPTTTISRGTILMEDGEIIEKPGHGQFLAV